MAKYPIISTLELNDIIKCKVHDPNIYQSAFVHKSALKQYASHKFITESYERLEFIGDSVINFAVTRMLFNRFLDKDEGFLTKVRTKLVSGTTLAGLGKKLGLQKYIIMNDRGLLNGWNSNERILEDVFEAFVGALYLDLGLIVVNNFMQCTIEQYIDFLDVLKDDNYKDMLMRYTQSNNFPLPIYQSLDSVVDKEKIYEVHCWVNRMPCGYGRHKNKKQAEQKAAYQALLFHQAL